MAEVGFAVMNLSTLTVYLVRDRDFSEGQAGLAMTVFLLSEAILKGTTGNLGDKYGLTRFIRIAPLIPCVTIPLTLLIPHDAPWEVVAIIVLRIFDGFAAAMLWPNIFALGGGLVEESRRQRAMASINACYLFGIAIAFPLGGLVDDFGGPFLLNFTGKYSGGFFLAMVLFVIVAFATWSLKEPEVAVEVEASEDFRAAGTALRRIPAYLFLGFVAFMAVGFPLTTVKLFALDQFNLTSAQFGLLACPGALSLAVMSAPMTRLGERIGHVRAVHLGLLLCTLGAAMVAAGGLFPMFRSLWMLALGGIPLGVGFLLTLPAWLARVSELDPGRRGANLGAVMAAQGVGAILGAPIGAWIYSLGSEPIYRFGPFMATFISLLVAWLLSLRLMPAYLKR